MRTPEMEARHQASAVVSRMMLICCRAMLVGYSRGKNIAAVFPEMLVVMAIRSNDDRSSRPISISGIARLTGLPRANVQRSLALLVQHRVVKRSGNGYIGDDSYLEARLHAPYFKRIVRAIRAASRELQGFP
jgi:predicted transcriptional regulator